MPRLPADDGCATGGAAAAIVSDLVFESAPAASAAAGADWIFALAISSFVTCLANSVAARPCATRVEEAKASASEAGVAAGSTLI